jgi:hypothetical protein
MREKVDVQSSLFFWAKKSNTKILYNDVYFIKTIVLIFVIYAHY